MAHSGELADCDAATSRSSAKRVASVVSKFNSLKKKLVTDIGFGGILQMPQINKTPRKFTVWLLSKVDFSTRSIVVNGRCQVKLTDEAFHRVLGIPCGPKKLEGLDSNELQDKSDFIKLAIGSITTDPAETCCLKVAEDIVTMEYTNGMNKEQTDRFKIAFVVFVVGHFLVAKTRTNHGIEEYWGSLLNTSEIHLHNFCTMVIDEIIESAKRVQDELKAKRTIKNVTGCTLGLQVLYLDSLSLDGFVLPRDKLPRIAIFDLIVLKNMINADQDNNISYSHTEVQGSAPISDSGCRKRVRFEGNDDAGNKKQYVTEFKTPKPAVSTYLTAYLRGTIEQKLTYGQVDALKRHNARMTYHVRKTKNVLLDFGGNKLTADGLKTIIEVHMEELMAKIFQDNLNLAQKLHNQCSKQSRPADHDGNFSKSINVSSEHYSNKSECESSLRGRSFSESGHSSNIGTAKERREEYTPLLGKQLFYEDSASTTKLVKKEPNCQNNFMTPAKKKDKNSVEPFILSEKDIDAIINHGSRVTVENKYVKKLKCRQQIIAPNPWKKGDPRKVVSSSVTNDLCYWLQNNNMPTLKRNWIEHALPKYIEIDGWLLKGIFIKGNPFSTDAFDIALRRMVQLDCWMYGHGRKLCWRHIMESDFAAIILNNMDPLESISVIYQLTTKLNEYDISECRMIVIPAMVNNSWCAYFWDMEEYIVHVIDPLYRTPSSTTTEENHSRVIAKIQCAFSKIVSLLFDGWDVVFSRFRTQFVDPIIPSATRGSDGLLTLLSIQEFDGSKFTENQNEGTIEAFNKLVLYEMVSLDGNYGIIPPGYTQTIN